MEEAHKDKPLKKRPKTPRARASAARLIKKAQKKLAKLLAEIPDEFVDLALRRIGEQLNATKPMWSVAKKIMIDIPDEKIRQDAALVILAYKWGKPVERSITAVGDVDDFAAMLERYRHSPAAQDSLQKTVEGKEIALALPQSQREEENRGEVKNFVER
jgi:hypothetical protein